MLLAHMTSFELPSLVAAAGVGFVLGAAACYVVMRHRTSSSTPAAESAESDH